jgi:Thymidylate synthase complementing protein
MRVSLIWSSPKPERTIAVAMRRCYSTKPIEEIEAELEAKGPEYWKYLISKAMQDKSLDVLEHFTMTLLVEGVGAAEMGRIVMAFPYLRAANLKGDEWIVSLNARTLVELWRDGRGKSLAKTIISELDEKKVSPIFNALAFESEIHAS